MPHQSASLLHTVLFDKLRLDSLEFTLRQNRKQFPADIERFLYRPVCRKTLRHIPAFKLLGKLRIQQYRLQKSKLIQTGISSNLRSDIPVFLLSYDFFARASIACCSALLPKTRKFCPAPSISTRICWHSGPASSKYFSVSSVRQMR